MSTVRDHATVEEVELARHALVMDPLVQKRVEEILASRGKLSGFAKMEDWLAAFEQAVSETPQGRFLAEKAEITAPAKGGRS